MSRTDRIELWMALDKMPDAGDLTTWTVGGRPLTAEELRTLLSFTVQDIYDVLELMRLHNELSQP